MYERNAIVIDRYFSGMFGYDEKCNLKNNYSNYCELIGKFKKYQDVSNEEDQIMLEVEKIANEIKDTQKMQDSFHKRTVKLQEERKSLFEDLDEDASELRRKFEKINEDLERNNADVKSNIERFIEEIAEFNGKSITRSQCGKERRIVENEYRKISNITSDNYNAINVNKVNDANEFLKKENNDKEKQEIKAQILKNGLKEKVPFNEEVIVKAIEIATDVEEKKLQIFSDAYERTGKAFEELKNENIKLDRHQKFIKESSAKIAILNAISDYIILFLDNERMNAVSGSKEHRKLMEEACQNFDMDMVQIKNLYDLLNKEINGRIAKKSYRELYHPEYLADLLEEESNFERTISKLNVIGTVIFPSYWRIEGMQKIFDAFRTIVTEEYGRDLSEYEPIESKIFNKDENAEMEEDEKENDDEEFSKYDWEEDKEHEDDSDDDNNDENDDWDNDDDFDEDKENEDDLDDDDDWDDDWDDDNDDNDDNDDDDDNQEDEDSKDDNEDEDKTIDEILGFYDENDDDSENKNDVNDIDEDEEEDDDDDEDDELDFDWDDDELDDNENSKPTEKSEEAEYNHNDDTEKEENKKEEEKEKSNRRRGFFNRRRR